MPINRTLVFIIICLWCAGGAAAQQPPPPEPTRTPLGPVFVPSPTFTPSPTPGITTTPESDDPRLAVCSAPFQRGFVPYRVSRHDRLADLLIGVRGLTITQVAALNCLDDPAALPAGAIIWLPPGALYQLASVEPQDASPGADRAAIASLTASGEQVLNESQGVTFSWKASGTAAYFYVCPPRPELTCERPISAQPVPLEYTTFPITGFHYAGPVRFRLEVVDGQARQVEDIVVEVACLHEAMGETAGFPACPVAPVSYVFQAWQPFENGVMMWISETRQIWVMTFDGLLTVYDDTYTEGDSDPASTPPPGEFFTPVRGFGKVWAALGGPDGPLGWATGEETGYQSGWQPAGNYSYTTYIGAPFGILYAVTRAPGSRTGYWHQIR